MIVAGAIFKTVGIILAVAVLIGVLIGLAVKRR